MKTVTVHFDGEGTHTDASGFNQGGRELVTERIRKNLAKSALTERERALALAICQGLKTQEVADAVKASVGEVRLREQALCTKLGVSDRLGLSLAAYWGRLDSLRVEVDAN